jgi:hypothetical protein
MAFVRLYSVNAGTKNERFGATKNLAPNGEYANKMSAFVMKNEVLYMTRQ